ncbi:MAG: type II toxin-antitoxin system Phd/YefM family antitoxin [Sphingomonadaceae bacterium]|nr:type II toxin-antitoxin system Phd/YefM family antitoxin [Sphingomonadaceae bacterium]
MGAIAANDLKVHGVKAIEGALAQQPEATISVRGKVKYVVVDAEHYNHLRECELEAALAESRADIAAGRFVREDAGQHIRRLKQKLG